MATTSDVFFNDQAAPVRAPTGVLLSEAANMAGLDIHQPCGGQGRCGRCAVIVTDGAVRRRSTLRLSTDDVASGYALACQAVVEGDVRVTIPPQEKIERRLVTDLSASKVTVPNGYDPVAHQPLQRHILTLPQPTMDDQISDWQRLRTALRRMAGLDNVASSLMLLRELPQTLRAGDWTATVVIDRTDAAQPRLVALTPGPIEKDQPLWALAIDIGTTTVTVWLVDVISGQVKARSAEYNGQIARGEDVISRIIFSEKGKGATDLQRLVVDTINKLIDVVCLRTGTTAPEIHKAVIAGNSTMMHLLLGIPARHIRLSPFVTAANDVPLVTAADIGLAMNPNATVDCLPGIASYVGADISAGVLSSGITDSDTLSLFLDIGTNGEMVLGNNEFLATCACSAGPAFEGGGVLAGMRATTGAIEEVWIHSDTHEPSYRVIGGEKPTGFCGSGLIALLAEMLLTGVIDKGGNINLQLPTPRTREGDHGPEYVVAWPDETTTGEALTITRVDIDNLMRAKAAIYAGFSLLAEKVGVPLDMAERVLVGGAFGKHINVEKAIEIGLLPDIPWSNFHFLGNTAIHGAYLALLNHETRQRINEIADQMTYVELSADNSFYEAFSSALFLPHTDLTRFPSTMAKLAA